ncbi:MAG: TetR/AcrR family transcriptional regulator [Chloroflexota bacterium]
MTVSEWTHIQTHILEFEEKGLVTRTFRRLDPDRQQIIIAAILSEAIEKGPADLNIKQVAERAGVSVGSLYTYFGNRDGLMNFAIALCIGYLTDAFETFRPMLAALPLTEALTAYLGGGIEWSRTWMGLIQFFARAAYRGDAELGERVVRPIADAMRRTVQDILQAAIERGELRPDIDLEAATRLVHGLTIVVGDSQLLPYLNTYFQTTADTVAFERVLKAMISLIEEGFGSKK